MAFSLATMGALLLRKSPARTLTDHCGLHRVGKCHSGSPKSRYVVVWTEEDMYLYVTSRFDERSTTLIVVQTTRHISLPYSQGTLLPLAKHLRKSGQSWLTMPVGALSIKQTQPERHQVVNRRSSSFNARASSKKSMQTGRSRPSQAAALTQRLNAHSMSCTSDA